MRHLIWQIHFLNFIKIVSEGCILVFIRRWLFDILWSSDLSIPHFWVIVFIFLCNFLFCWFIYLHFILSHIINKYRRPFRWWAEIFTALLISVSEKFVAFSINKKKKRQSHLMTLTFILVAGAGFEPTTFGLWARRATNCSIARYFFN